MKLHGAILIDVSAGTDSSFERSLLDRLGHPVLLCHGPAESGDCPILIGAGCELVESAHGIIFELDLDLAQHRTILQRYRKIVAADVPIGAVVRPGQETRYADVLEGIVVWTSKPTTDELGTFAATSEAYDRAVE